MIFVWEVVWRLVVEGVLLLFSLGCVVMLEFSNDWIEELVIICVLLELEFVLCVLLWVYFVLIDRFEVIN